MSALIAKQKKLNLHVLDLAWTCDLQMHTGGIFYQNWLEKLVNDQWSTWNFFPSASVSVKVFCHCVEITQHSLNDLILCFVEELIGEDE